MPPAGFGPAFTSERLQTRALDLAATSPGFIVIIAVTVTVVANRYVL